MGPEFGRTLLKMFSLLLLLTPLALALPWITLERQLPVKSRQGGYGEGYGSSCSEAHYQECSPYEINCDAGYDSMGCWYGNYCIQQEVDGCLGVRGVSCDNETDDWCDMGNDSNGCWMGSWCQDKSEGGCPAPQYGLEMASDEDACAHVQTWHETCNSNQTSCDLGYSPEHCWYGNYCVDMDMGSSCYGLSELATAMERAGKSNSYKSHITLGHRGAEYYWAQSIRAQLADLAKKGR